MITIEFTINEDHACFKNNGLWNELDRIMNIMKQHVYQTVKDPKYDEVRLSIMDEATGTVVESDGNICGQWKVTKRTGNLC